MDSATINDCLNHINELHRGLLDVLTNARNILDAKLTMTEKINKLNEIMAKEKDSEVKFAVAVMNVRKIIANRHCADCDTSCDDCKIRVKEEE